MVNDLRCTQRRVIELEETLQGKQTALEGLIAENEHLKRQLHPNGTVDENEEGEHVRF